MDEKMMDEEEFVDDLDEKEVVDDLEEKRFIFLENIGIELIIDRMQTNDMEMKKRMGNQFFKTSSPSFLLSESDTEDAKKSELKFMRLNHGKYEEAIVDLPRNKFGYSKAEYKIMENGKDFMKTKPYFTDDDISYIKRYPIIKKIIEDCKYLKNQRNENVDTLSHDYTCSDEDTIFFERITTLLKDRYYDFKHTLQTLINKYSDEYYIKFGTISAKSNVVRFFCYTNKVDEPKITKKDVKEIKKLIDKRIFEKYGFHCEHFDKNTSGKLYSIRSLLTLGLFDSNDIKILLDNAKEETTIFGILTSLPGNINSGNIKEYKKFLGKYVEMYFKKNYTSKEDELKDESGLLYYHLTSRACNSLEIIDLFWDGEYIDYDYYWEIFLEYFKDLDGSTLESYLTNYHPNNKGSMLTGSALERLCLNATVTLDVIKKFLSLHKDYTKQEFDLYTEGIDKRFLSGIIGEHKWNKDSNRDGTVVDIILFFIEKRISFQENSDLCYAFQVFSFTYEQSLKIINLYVEFMTGKNYEKSEDLIESYKEIEDEKDSLVASLCYNKQSSFDFLKSLLDNRMDVNKTAHYKSENKSQGLAIYNVIFNSDIARFELIKNYNLQLQNDDLEIDCMKFICQCNPTVEFGKIFFEYALEKKHIKIPDNSFLYDYKYELRLCADFLQLFFKYRQIFMEDNREKIKTHDKFILQSIRENLATKLNEEMIYGQLTHQILNVILENNNYLKEKREKMKNRDGGEEDDEYVRTTNAILFLSFYYTDLRSVKSLLDNGINVQVDHINYRMNNIYPKEEGKEFLFLVLDYTSLEVISKCLGSIAKMDIRVEVVSRILLRVELLYPKYSKDEINLFLDYLSKGDKFIPWGYGGVIKEEDKKLDKGEIIEMLVMYQKRQLPLWNYQFDKMHSLVDRETTKIFETFVKTMHVLSKKSPFFTRTNPLKIPKNIYYVIFTHLLRSYINRPPSKPQSKPPLDSIHIIENNNMIDDDYENNTNKRKFEEEQPLSILGSNKREKKK